VALVVVVGFNRLFGLCCGGNGSIGALECCSNSQGLASVQTFLLAAPSLAPTEAGARGLRLPSSLCVLMRELLLFLFF